MFPEEEDDKDEGTEDDEDEDEEDEDEDETQTVSTARPRRMSELHISSKAKPIPQASSLFMFSPTNRYAGILLVEQNSVGIEIKVSNRETIILNWRTKFNFFWSLRVE